MLIWTAGVGEGHGASLFGLDSGSRKTIGANLLRFPATNAGTQEAHGR